MKTEEPQSDWQPGGQSESQMELPDPIEDVQEAPTTGNSPGLDRQTREATRPTETASNAIVAYQLRSKAPQLRKGQRRRGWMDRLPEHHAYRCLPMVIANQEGWDLINPATFTATWNGGPECWDLQIRWASGGWTHLVRSHFASGILTFNVGYLFRTPPGIGLLVCGPPNLVLDGAFPLAGVVETDWSASTFTMNYQMTRPGHPVTFEAGEPFCRILPLDRRLIERLDPEIRLLGDHPALERDYREWESSRSRFITESRIQFSAAHEQRWQKEYFQGKQSTGAMAPDHQTQLKHREFKDLRPPTVATTQDPGSQSRPATVPEPASPPGPNESQPVSPPKPTVKASEAGSASRPETGVEAGSGSSRAAGKPVDYSVLTSVGLLRDLTEAQRLEVLRKFCATCGREDPTCPCGFG